MRVFTGGYLPERALYIYDSLKAVADRDPCTITLRDPTEA
jgi:hypothetical protein